MASDIPLDKAYLTAIWLETLFYGMQSHSSTRIFPTHLRIHRHEFCLIRRLYHDTHDISTHTHNQQDPTFRCPYHVLLLVRARLPRLPTTHRGLHPTKRMARRANGIFLRRFYSCQRRQGRHSYCQCKPSFLNVRILSV